MMLEGAGFRADGRGHGARTPTDMLAQARCSGRVPLVTAVLGAVGRARRARRADVGLHGDEPARRRSSRPARRSCSSRSARRSPRKTSAVPRSRSRAGSIHNVADDDAAALDLVRAYLRYFPSSAWSYPPDTATATTSRRGSSPRCSTSCRATVGAVYDMRKVIDVVFDAGSALRGATRVRPADHLRAVPARRPSGRGRREPAAA